MSELRYDGQTVVVTGAGGGLGKARSRYESPSRGYSTKPVAYGQSSINYRAASADSNYSTRREPLFANNQTVGDLRH